MNKKEIIKIQNSIDTLIKYVNRKTRKRGLQQSLYEDTLKLMSEIGEFSESILLIKRRKDKITGDKNMEWADMFYMILKIAGDGRITTDCFIKKELINDKRKWI